MHCNRIIQAPGCVTEQKVFVMWSSSRTDAVAEHWVPNHFVPLMLPQAQECIGAPKRGSFHLISWNGSDYIGQVQDLDELLEMACVSFLSRRGNTNMYSLPVRADYSWEPFTAFQLEVTLTVMCPVLNNKKNLY